MSGWTACFKRLPLRRSWGGGETAPPWAWGPSTGSGRTGVGGFRADRGWGPPLHSPSGSRLSPGRRRGWDASRGGVRLGPFDRLRANGGEGSGLIGVGMPLSTAPLDPGFRREDGEGGMRHAGVFVWGPSTGSGRTGGLPHPNLPPCILGKKVGQTVSPLVPRPTLSVVAPPRTSRSPDSCRGSPEPASTRQGQKEE